MVLHAVVRQPELQLRLRPVPIQTGFHRPPAEIDPFAQPNVVLRSVVMLELVHLVVVQPRLAVLMRQNVPGQPIHLRHRKHVCRNVRVRDIQAERVDFLQPVPMIYQEAEGKILIGV